MAEVFASASAAVGVAAAAGQLIDGIRKLKTFCSEVRDIPGDIKDTIEDLASLTDVLEYVEIQLAQNTATLAIQSGILRQLLTNLEQVSRHASEVLKDMNAEVEKNKGWGRVKAVGMKTKLERAIQRVERVQNYLVLALVTDNRQDILPHV